MGEREARTGGKNDRGEWERRTKVRTSGENERGRTIGIIDRGERETRMRGEKKRREREQRMRGENKREERKKVKIRRTRKIRIKNPKN